MRRAALLLVVVETRCDQVEIADLLRPTSLAAKSLVSKPHEDYFLPGMDGGVPLSADTVTHAASVCGEDCHWDWATNCDKLECDGCKGCSMFKAYVIQATTPTPQVCKFRWRRKAKK